MGFEGSTADLKSASPINNSQHHRFNPKCSRLKVEHIHNNNLKSVATQHQEPEPETK